ncbi:unnamed protein product [Mucor fragilis]
MTTGEYTKAIARFSRMRKNRTIKPSFSPEPTVNRAPADVMADHFKNIFAGQLLTSTPNTDPPTASTNSPHFASDQCPFSSDQIHETLQQLPRKKAPVAPSSDTQFYQLHGTTIHQEHSFLYLDIPIKAGGLLNYSALVQHNINKASHTLNQLTAIGLNSKGFPPLLASRFYSQMVQSQLDYGLAISPLSNNLIHQLDAFQNQCIRRIFGGHSKSSAQVMLHLVNLPSMRSRVAILQA